MILSNMIRLDGAFYVIEFYSYSNLFSYLKFSTDSL